MSFTTQTNEFDILIKMSKDILDILKQEDRMDLVAYYKDMMRNIYDLDYSSGDQSSDGTPDLPELVDESSDECIDENGLVIEKYTVGEDKDGFCYLT